MITLHADPAADSGGSGANNTLSSGDSSHAFNGIGPAIVALEASGPNARGDAVTLLLHNATGIADTDASGTMNQFDVATTAARYLQIEGALPLLGVFSEKLWYLQVTDRSGIYNNVTNHLRLKNIQIRLILNTGAEGIALKTTNANQDAADIDNRVENFILVCEGTNKSQSIGANPKPTGGTVITNNYWNGLIQGFRVPFSGEELVCRVANCLAVDSEFGWGASVAFRIDNSAAMRTWNGNGFSGTFHASSDFNASDDGSHPGATGQTGSIAFVNRQIDNFITAAGDTIAIGNGTTDPLGVSSTDMRGYTRSDWDIGPFEAVTGTAALTGTSTASIDEDDVQAGGQTAILTLTNDTWVPSNVTQDIQVIGTPQGTAVGNGGNVTLTFSEAPLTNDVVIVWGGHAATVASSVTPVTAGYNQIINDTADAPYFGVWWKRMGAVPDTTVEFPGDANVANSTYAGCIVLRHVHDDVIGATTTVAGPTAGTNPDPASITTGSVYSMVLALAVSTASDAAPGTVANYTVFSSAGNNETGVDMGGSGARRVMAAAGAENPPAWSTWATGTWKTATLEIKRRVDTPFADVRAVITNPGFDSDQAEGTGWDARRGTVLPVSAVVRTSDTVVTVTFVADATYDITAQETVTVTIPAVAVNGGVAIVASPTFTVDAAGAGGFVPFPRPRGLEGGMTGGLQ